MNTTSETNDIRPAKAGGIGSLRTAVRWLAAGVIGIALPKCIVCVAGYFALATGVATAPELCGTARESGAAPWLLLVMVPLAVAGLIRPRRNCATLSGREPVVR